MTYTFRLRSGVTFHNGKALTSADVAASFNRYNRIGLQRSTLDNVAGWDTPDPMTFVIRMKVAQPTFIEALSSFSVPIVIIPFELEADDRQQLRTIGTGPFRLLEFVPGSHARLGRYDGYSPNTNFEQRTGFGGYRVACVDTVTFRIVTEAPPASRGSRRERSRAWKTRRPVRWRACAATPPSPCCLCRTGGSRSRCRTRRWRR